MSVLAGAVLASTVSSVGYVIVVLTLIAFAVAVFINIRRARAETGSELELAPNRVPHHPDEVLEGPVLNRNLAFGLGAIVIISIGLPVYWLGEPARNEGAQATFDRVAAERGAEQFAVTAEGGLNCAGCHGGMDAPGGVAPYTINDANGEFVASVEWQAPALNTVLLRFDEEELYDILVYGRPFSPMPAWGIEGGGALNDQQIGNLIAYLKTIQITPEEAQDGGDRRPGRRHGERPVRDRRRGAVQPRPLRRLRRRRLLLRALPHPGLVLRRAGVGRRRGARPQPDRRSEPVPGRGRGLPGAGRLRDRGLGQGGPLRRPRPGHAGACRASTTC